MTIVRRTSADIDDAALRGQLAKARLRSDAEIEQDAIEGGDEWTEEDFERATRVFPPLAPARVAALRERLGMTQRQFAARFGIPVADVEACELGCWTDGGRTTPPLMLVEADPEAALRVLHARAPFKNIPADDPARAEIAAE